MRRRKTENEAGRGEERKKKEEEEILKVNVLDSDQENSQGKSLILTLTRISSKYMTPFKLRNSLERAKLAPSLKTFNERL